MLYMACDSLILSYGSQTITTTDSNEATLNTDKSPIYMCSLCWYETKESWKKCMWEAKIAGEADKEGVNVCNYLVWLLQELSTRSRNDTWRNLFNLVNIHTDKLWRNLPETETSSGKTHSWHEITDFRPEVFWKPASRHCGWVTRRLR